MVNAGYLESTTGGAEYSGSQRMDPPVLRQAPAKIRFARGVGSASLRIPPQKIYLQPLNGVAPLWSRGLANGVLIAEEAQFVNGLIFRDGVEPLDTDEILGAVGIAGFRAQFRGGAQDFDGRTPAGRDLYGEVVQGLHCIGHAAHADVAFLWNLHPHAIAGREKL